jgi:hypothetical protein
MKANFEKRISAVWLALSVITIVSWLIGAPHGHESFQLNAAITFSVLVIAAIKVRIIMREFMEIRGAPALLRNLTDAWLLTAFTIMLGVYTFGSYHRFNF